MASDMKAPASPILPESLAARWILLLILLVAAYFFIGFLVPVLAALVIGFASWSLYQQLVQLCRGRTTLAAAIATGIVTLGLVIPVAVAFSYAVEEIKGWLVW